MEEEALKERSSVVRTQVPLAVGAYLLNEKRQDVADIEQRTGTHVLIIPNMNLETPHYIVERLRDDPEEQHDMAEEKPELTARLTKMLHDWRKKSGARMPTPNAAYRETNDWRNK